MKKPKAIHHKQLRQRVDISQLDFATTQTIVPTTEFIGQERALEAIHIGIGLKKDGYNLYAMGPSGIGKYSLLHSVLETHGKKASAPSDWCYIHNFVAPEKPNTLELPAGRGVIFQQEMKLLLDELSVIIINVFESDDYRIGMKKIHDKFTAKKALARKKRKKSSPYKAYTLFKLKNQEEQYLQKKLITAAIEPVIAILKKKYVKFPDVIQYLSAVQEDLLQHSDDFIRQDEKTNLLTFTLENPALMRYKVNLIVDNSQLKGLPVILEENPTYSNLICRIDQATQQGNSSTNFNFIHGGSMHRANGGYLIIESRKILNNQEAWEALKSALYSKKLKIEPLQNAQHSMRTFPLEPVPIPLDIKIILLGDRATYYSLCQNDPDFLELFKVPVDFNEEIPRNKYTILLYSRLIATIAKKNNLLPLDVEAVAEVIDYSTRLAEDVDKLSTYVSDIEDIIIQADYWASLKNKKLINIEDIQKAIDAKIHRMDRSRELYYQDIFRKFIIINTEKKMIGQVNCLSVRKVGNFSYGHPTRVTARVSAGKGRLIDIQREIKMAGPIHSKGGLIIANFLASRFNQMQSLSLSASIAFEQIYCWTEGDSASVGELCALLSALTEIPINQQLAVTGSMDQYGEVQAIGGVNDKIEGFFDICKANGLSGQHGVIIPEVNLKNLMLREDIVEAAKLKKFAIYPIRFVEEAINLLTGMTAIKLDAKKNYAKDSFYYHVEKQLKKFANLEQKKSKTNKKSK